jgi:hypothetical protein
MMFAQVTIHENALGTTYKTYEYDINAKRAVRFSHYLLYLYISVTGIDIDPLLFICVAVDSRIHPRNRSGMQICYCFYLSACYIANMWVYYCIDYLCPFCIKMVFC